ncbi:MAG: hypothetical protein ACE148_07890 [Vicinamibacterales bacterium]
MTLHAMSMRGLEVVEHGAGPRAAHAEHAPKVVRPLADATRRPYRDAWPVHRAISRLRGRAGVEFGPQFVDRFVSMIVEAGEADIGSSS